MKQLYVFLNCQMLGFPLNSKAASSSFYTTDNAVKQPIAKIILIIQGGMGRASPPRPWVPFKQKSSTHLLFSAHVQLWETIISPNSMVKDQRTKSTSLLDRANVWEVVISFFTHIIIQLKIIHTGCLASAIFLMADDADRHLNTWKSNFALNMLNQSICKDPYHN